MVYYHSFEPPSLLYHTMSGTTDSSTKSQFQQDCEAAKLKQERVEQLDETTRRNNRASNLQTDIREFAAAVHKGHLRYTINRWFLTRNDLGWPLAWKCTEKDYQYMFEEINKIKGNCFTCTLTKNVLSQFSIDLQFVKDDISCPEFTQITADIKRKEFHERIRQSNNHIYQTHQVMSELYDKTVQHSFQGSAVTEGTKQFNLTPRGKTLGSCPEKIQYTDADYEYFITSLKRMSGETVECEKTTPFFGLIGAPYLRCRIV